MAYPKQSNPKCLVMIYILFGTKKTELNGLIPTKKSNAEELTTVLYIYAKKINPKCPHHLRICLFLLINECLNLGDKNLFMVNEF